MFWLRRGFLTGADSHCWSPQQNGSARITASERIFVTTPAVGEYGENVYSGSGRNITKIIYNATSAKSRFVRMAVWLKILRMPSPRLSAQIKTS
nr:hypothetical protein [Pseudomonas sp. PGPR40]